MIVVVDATVAVHAALAGTWTSTLLGATLAAPTLLWSEVVAAIRQLEFRSEITRDQANSGLAWFEREALEVHPSRNLMADAIELARKLGWAKTYDAEYVVLARRLGCTLVTTDARLRTTAASVISPMSYTIWLDATKPMAAECGPTTRLLSMSDAKSLGRGRGSARGGDGGVRRSRYWAATDNRPSRRGRGERGPR